MHAEVLNGTVEAGDRVAYGTRDGNSGGIRVGVVLEVIPFESREYNYETHLYEPCTRHELKVEVTHTSRYGKPQRPVRVGCGRVVKLA